MEGESDAKKTKLVDTGNAEHAEESAISEREAILVRANRAALRHMKLQQEKRKQAIANWSDSKSRVQLSDDFQTLLVDDPRFFAMFILEMYSTPHASFSSDIVDLALITVLFQVNINIAGLVLLSAKFYQMLTSPDGGVSVACDCFLHTSPHPLKKNIFESKLIMVPINVSNNHWMLLVACMPAKQVRIYNSLPSYSKAAKICLGHFRRCLEFESKIIYHAPLEASCWTFEVELKAQPQIYDSSEVFVCKYAERILTSWDPDRPELPLADCHNIFWAGEDIYYKTELLRRIAMHATLQPKLAKLRRSVDKFNVYILICAHQINRVGWNSSLYRIVGREGRMTKLPLDILRKLYTLFMSWVD
jgi:hypothetical protein